MQVTCLGDALVIIRPFGFYLSETLLRVYLGQVFIIVLCVLLAHSVTHKQNIRQLSMRCLRFEAKTKYGSSNVLHRYQKSVGDASHGALCS